MISLPTHQENCLFALVQYQARGPTFQIVSTPVNYRHRSALLAAFIVIAPVLYRFPSIIP